MGLKIVLTLFIYIFCGAGTKLLVCAGHMPYCQALHFTFKSTIFPPAPSLLNSI